MRGLRKVVFWLHLVVGLAVGVFVTMMAGTGLLMAYEHPIVEKAETYDGRPAKPGQQAKTIEWLLEAAMNEVPDASPTAFTAYSDLDKPAQVQFGRETVLYLNNYTAKPAGVAAAGWRGFFHTVEELHRWLAATGDWRNWGRWATGITNLCFLTLIFSGLWLWFPKRLRWTNLKAVVVPSLRLKGKARDWNWHNAVGFWALIPLSVIVMTGTVISYPWATNLVYRAVGETPPAGRGGPATQPGGERRGGERGGERGMRGEGGRGMTGMGGGQPLNTEGLGDLWANAEDASPGWTQITLRLGGGRGQGGAGGPGGGGRGGPGGSAGGGTGGEPEAEATRGGVSFTVVHGNPLNPANRTTLTYNRRTGELISKQAFTDQTLGRRLRTLTVPVHRGEVLGLTGMTIAAGCCVSALVLVYTGFALSYRRLVRPVVRRWHERRSSVAAERPLIPSPAYPRGRVREGA